MHTLEEEISKLQGQSSVTSQLNTIYSVLEEKIRQRVSPSEPENNSQVDKSLKEKANITQTRAEKEIEQLCTPRRVTVTELTKLKNEVDFLRKERRKLKNLKNEYATDSNKLGESLLQQSQIEVEINEIRRKIKKHIKQKKVMNNEEAQVILGQANSSLNNLEQAIKFVKKGYEARLNSSNRLKDQIFSLERALNTEGLGLPAPVIISKAQGGNGNENGSISSKPEDIDALKKRLQTLMEGTRSLVIETMIKEHEKLFPTQPDGKLPEIVTRTIGFLENTDKAMTMENIIGMDDYKLPKVKQIKDYFDQGYDVDLSKCADFYIVGTLLVLYFKELEQPLLTSKLYENFMKFNEIPQESRLNYLKENIEKLPETNKATLAILLEFLDKVSTHSSVNLLTTQRLSHIFGPILLNR